MITELGLIARRYEAIDRVVSPIWQNDVCDMAFPLLECAVALGRCMQNYPILADKVARPDDAATARQAA